MIKKLHHQNITENYDHCLTVGNRTYEVCWKNKVLQYYTCGSKNLEIECLDFLDGSLSIREVYSNGEYGRPISLTEYNAINPGEPLDFKCNCHGFTFANGKFFIDSFFVKSILEEEFVVVTDSEEITDGNFDVICFLDENNEWTHSCKYEYELFIQKEGIRKFTIHRSVDEIMNIEEYKNSSPRYFRRRDRSCPGLCISAVGEEHVKTFANNMR